MNTLDKQYQDLLQTILDYGVEKKDRTGTGTKSIFGYTIRHNMKHGFPLLTTKKMYFKGIITELLWFLRGDTNIKYLVDNDCHIWDGDAYKNYKTKTEIMMGHGFHGTLLSQEEFINKIKTDDEFANTWGELGSIYGKQWRGWGGELSLHIGLESDGSQDKINFKKGIDQIANLINDLKTNPDSRRLMVSAWNVGELDQMTLPPCHYGFQVYTRELSQKERYDWYIETYNKNITRSSNQFNIDDILNTNGCPTRAISLMWNQRSVDTFLGLPFNIASYGLLLEIIAKEVNMVPDELIGNLGDTHLYLNHIEQAKEQIGRELSFDERVEYFKKTYPGEWDEYELPKDNFSWYNIPKRTREPYPLPKLMICGDMTRTDGFTVPFDELDHSLIKLIDYQSHPTIKAPLSN